MTTRPPSRDVAPPDLVDAVRAQIDAARLPCPGCGATLVSARAFSAAEGAFIGAACPACKALYHVGDLADSYSPASPTERGTAPMSATTSKRFDAEYARGLTAARRGAGQHFPLILTHTPNVHGSPGFRAGWRAGCAQVRNELVVAGGHDLTCTAPVADHDGSCVYASAYARLTGQRNPLAGLIAAFDAERDRIDRQHAEPTIHDCDPAASTCYC